MLLQGLEWKPRLLTKQEYFKEREDLRHGHPGVPLPPTINKYLASQRGIPFGEITELCSPDKHARTIIVHWVILAALRLHPDYECIYIDTKSKKCTTFRSDYLLQLIESQCNHRFHSLPIYEKSLFNRVFVNYIDDLYDLHILLDRFLHEWLKSRPFRTALLVIDDVQWPFLWTHADVHERSELCLSIGELLHKLAILHHVSILITNGTVTKYDGLGMGRLVPALGKPWDEQVDHRLMIFPRKLSERGDTTTIDDLVERYYEMSLSKSCGEHAFNQGPDDNKPVCTFYLNKHHMKSDGQRQAIFIEGHVRFT